MSADYEWHLDRCARKSGQSRDYMTVNFITARVFDHEVRVYMRQHSCTREEAREHVSNQWLGLPDVDMDDLEDDDAEDSGN